MRVSLECTEVNITLLISFKLVDVNISLVVLKMLNSVVYHRSIVMTKLLLGFATS